jgi:hypothetical protein
MRRSERPRFEALEPICQGVRQQFGVVPPGSPLACRCGTITAVSI